MSIEVARKILREGVRHYQPHKDGGYDVMYRVVCGVDNAGDSIHKVQKELQPSETLLGYMTLSGLLVSGCDEHYAVEVTRLETRAN